LETAKKIWIKIFGIIFVFISLYGLATMTILSVSLNVKSDYVIITICIIPAILGIEILRLSNIFRKITIGFSLGLVIFAPLGYFLVSQTDSKNIYLASLAQGNQWIFLVLFGVCSIFYLTRREIKNQFSSSQPGSS
jgi:hypothetical protein